MTRLSLTTFLRRLIMAIEDLSLPHTFIHKTLSDRTVRLLKRFSRQQLLELIKLWLNNSRYAPPILSEEKRQALDDKNDGDEPPNDDIELIRERFFSVDSSSMTRAHIFREITLDYWSKGLNLFQVAEIESKYILEFQNRHSWTYSTFKLDSGEEFVPVIEPESFLTAFQTALYPMVLGHTYITRHSELSLTILRLQLFNPKPRPTSPLVPMRPIYLAFPTSSPHLLHSSGEDVSMRAVFHALKAILSSPSNHVALAPSTDIPSKSLKAFATLKGVSRHAASLGPWAVYAADRVDSSVLSMKPHPQQKQMSTDETSRRKDLANIRFHGVVDSPEKMPVEIQTFEAKLKEPCEEANFTPSIKIRLEGENVFGGMHKLALDGIADPETIPDWLTGEEPHQLGTVENGRFISRAEFQS